MRPLHLARAALAALAALWSCCALFAAPALAQTGPRLALVIGNADYPSVVGALSHPHRDARLIADALEEVGFTLVAGGPVLDADKDEIERQVLAFQRALSAAGSDAVGFFYYSGHGGSNEIDGQRTNYLIPARAPITGAGELPLLGVELPDIINTLASSGARAVFVVSDACRNTLPFTSNMGGAQPDRGFQAEGVRTGVFVAHATADGETAPDDGAFAEALASRLTEPGLTADRVFTLAFRAVAERRRGFRRPTVSDGLRGDVYFAGPARADAPPPLPVTSLPVTPPPRAPAEDFAEDPAEDFADLGPVVVEAVRSGDAARIAVLGDEFFMGRMGWPQDDRAAVRLYRQACDGGSARACLELGIMYVAGRGGLAPDQAEAVRLFRHACDGGNRNSCTLLRQLGETP